jgi:anti-sigma-K factor RskA
MKNVQNASLFAVTIEPKGGSENPTMDLMQVAGAV